MFKVLITGSSLPYKDKEIELLSDLAEVDIRDNESVPLTKNIEQYQVILVDTTEIAEPVLKKASGLRGVVQYGVGVDNIDVEAATRLGIPICNVPDACTLEVAEHAVALALALARQVVAACNLVKAGSWDFNQLSPTRIHGKTAGIIGLGRIGRHVAAGMGGLGCMCLAYDPYVEAAKFTGQRLALSSLDELLGQADFVFVCCPLTTDTKGMLGARQFGMMKPSAYLINTSRGAILDEESLCEALRQKHIRGAASDVLGQEPPARDNPLLALDYFLCTPHMAWKSEASVLDFELKAASEARRLLLGELPLNAINQVILGKQAPKAPEGASSR